MNTSPSAATVPNGPSSLPMKRRAPFGCRRLYTACPRFTGIGGWDCVDTKNDPEMCGGCLKLAGTSSEDDGQDCTAIPGVNVVKCKRGGCVIGKRHRAQAKSSQPIIPIIAESCRKGFTLSDDAKSCVKIDNLPFAVDVALGGLFFPH